MIFDLQVHVIPINHVMEKLFRMLHFIVVCECESVLFGSSAPFTQKRTVHDSIRF